MLPSKEIKGTEPQLVKGVGVRPDHPGSSSLLTRIWVPIFFLIKCHLVAPRLVELFHSKEIKGINMSMTDIRQSPYFPISPFFQYTSLRFKVQKYTE
jgi:hypothetical protein